MENKLRANGFEPINPHNTCKDIVTQEFEDEEALWKACMRADIRELMTADFIVALPGWDRSRGAHLEVGLAEMVGIPKLNVKLTQPVDSGAEQK